MAISLKPLDQQTIVITGASSGIGLATARAAAKAGARVMLAARDGDALEEICREIAGAGGEAAHRVTDVGDEAQIEALARETVDRFGGFDTWVNNAGIGVISTLERMSSEDHQAVFRTNYFGLVYGSLAAVRHFREKGAAGALINVGSSVGEVPLPLSVAYSATKHAVKGFTDGLRVELMREDLPVSVTLIKPSAIDTRFFDHAKSEMGGMGKGPGPNYAPEVVADAILYAAAHPKRDFPVGAPAVIGPTVDTLAPAVVDWAASALRLEDLVDFGHQPAAHSVDEVPGQGEERSRFGRGRRFSLSTSAQTHPGVTAVVTATGLALATGALMAALLATRLVGGSGRKAR